MRQSLPSGKYLNDIFKQSALLRNYRNNLTQTPLISIFCLLVWAAQAAIFPIYKADAAFQSTHTLR